MNPKSTYRVEEAAELCGCRAGEILAAIQEGRLDASRLGKNNYQISLYSLQEFYREREGKELFAEVGSDAHDKTVHDLFEVVSDIASETEDLDQFSKDFSHSGSR